MPFQASYMFTLTLQLKWRRWMDDSTSREKFSLVHRRSREQTKFHMERFLASFCTKKKIAGDLRARLLRSLSVTFIQLGDSQKKGINSFFVFFREWWRCWQDKFSSSTYQWRSQAFCLQGTWSRGSIKWTSGTW